MQDTPTAPEQQPEQTTTPVVPAAQDEQPPLAERSDPGSLLKFASTVHIGPGAEDCEHRDREKQTRDGAGCEDPEHYHLYLRIPNQFQHSDIREKALAAKARRRRQLEDPETDSAVVLEADIDAIRREGEGLRDTLIDELLAKDWLQDYLEAQADVKERDEFAHIDADRERWNTLDAMDAEERPHEEYDELVKHITAFEDAVEEARKELQRPRREALEGREFEELLGLIREQRIDAESQAAFMETYSKWMWYVGTLKPSATRPPSERHFANVEAINDAPTDVVLALTEHFTAMEAALSGPAGKGSR